MLLSLNERRQRRERRSRIRLILISASVGHLGWGAILPYQYVYASQARGWGQLVAALAAGLFSVGSLVGSPLFGRVADGRRPERVLMAAQAFAAAACLGLLASGSPPWFCLSSLIFGLGMMGAAPAKSVLVLHWTPAAAHRRVFAYRFAGESIGMASGAVVSGLLVDVTHPDGMTPAYVIGALSLSTALAVSAWAAHRALSAWPTASSTLSTSAWSGPCGC